MNGKFTRKAILVSDGPKNKALSSIKYPSGVSRGSVLLAFTFASLNDIDICACKIGNTYLHANYREKVWTTAGIEFGNEI